MKFLFALLFVWSCTSTNAKGPYDAETYTSQEDVIWGFDFLSPTQLIFTERGGKLFTLDIPTKKVTEVTGAPKVYAVGQGGLLDVRVHPKSKEIYLSYSEAIGDDKSTTALGKAKIEGNKLVNFTRIFSASPASENDYHYGSRIDFDGKGNLFLSVGERGERPLVQKDDTHLGKIIRMGEDGSNPKAIAKGLRNPQGMMFRPGTDELWEAEFGPRGGDEVNLIKEGNNYGWPVVTYGREYHGPKIGEGKTKIGMEKPVKYWVPSISPSAMTFYTGDQMPDWKGNIFLANLSGEHLRRLELTGQQITKEEELLKEKGWRFRNVRTGPDGYLWFSTDEGKIGRVIKK